MSTFDLNQIPSQKGRIAIVTGANIGLGYETTIGLAKKDIQVIMACRNLEKANKAKSEILVRVPNARLTVMELDLMSLKSVRAFAKSFIESHSRLDLLINNAGIMFPPFSITEEGFESQMGVNYFSHFLLTGLLLPLLEKTENSRIITLSSIAHKNAIIDFENLNSEKSYSKQKAYGQSKLACLLFSYELQRRLEKANSTTISVAAHPGVSNTNLGQHLPAWTKILVPVFVPLFTHKPEKAALPTLNAALGDVKGGEYYGPTGFNEMKGKPGKVSSNAISFDQDIARKLWTVSERLTQINFLD